MCENDVTLQVQAVERTVAESDDYGLLSNEQGEHLKIVKSDDYLYY